MSFNYKIEIPSCTLENAIHVLKNEDLLVYDIPINNKLKSPLDIIINSNELKKFKVNDDLLKEESFIYIARVGKKFDGHSLIEKILSSKNYFIGNEENVFDLAKKNNYSEDLLLKIINNPYFIKVKNTEKSINLLFEKCYQINNEHFNTIAVTGTNGKTSVVQICSQIFELLTAKSCLRIGTLGLQIGEYSMESSHVTTPDYPALLSIINLCQKINIDKIVMEATSHGLLEKRLGNWKVNTAIFTNLTQDHLDYHGTMDNYRNAKLKLFDEYLNKSGCAIICTNNFDWEFFAKHAAGNKRTLIGVGNENISKSFFSTFKNLYKSLLYLSITDQKSSLKGISGTLILRDCHKIIESEYFSAPIIGNFQFDNIMCSIAAMINDGFKISEISKKLANIKNIPGRLEIIKHKTEIDNKFPTVLVDYAHSPDALEKAILVCKNILSLEGRGKLITVFGCGGDRDKTKRPIMGKIASTLSDKVIVTSDNPRKEDPGKIIDDIFTGINSNNNCFRESDRKKAIEFAIQSAEQFDLILVAGKGHEDYQIIGETKYPFSDSQIALSILSKEN